MKQHVILLHGLARTPRSMQKIAKAFKRAGFSVENWHYPSRKMSVESLSEAVFSELSKRIPECDKIHFVTHSLGGIILRYYLSQHTLAKLGRVVMLAPPNQGSEVVDELKRWPLFQWFNGPAGQQLGTDSKGIAKQLPSVAFELGIIAGNRSINCYLSTLLPKPNDGKVSVEATKLAGMKAHLIVPTSHSFIMRNKTVIEQTLVFIMNGQFKLATTKRNH